MNWTSIFLLILVIILTALITLFFQRKKALAHSSQPREDLSAVQARKKALAIAKHFAGEHNCKILSPVTIAKNGKFADFDFILAGSFGLLCVKCIGLSGEIFGSKQDEEWAQVQNGTRTTFSNPLTVAAQDARVVRDCLFHAKIKNTPVESICIFTNPKASLVFPRSTGHYTLKTFRNLLQKEKFRLDKKVDATQAINAIQPFLSNASISR